MDLIILVLATWRISNLIIHENGPYNILDRFRDFVGIDYDDFGQIYGKNEFANGLKCMMCNTIWLGIIFTISYAIIPVYTTLILMPFALSAGAILFDEVKEWLEHRQ